MSFFEILSTLLIGPLKLIFEIIFAFAYKLTDKNIVVEHLAHI